MATEIVTSKEGGGLMAAASNGEDDYLLWQRSDSKPGEIYFEYNDQINSGYGIVEECTLDNDGCHIGLNNGNLVHFYWRPPNHESLNDLIFRLKEIYSKNPLIISDER